MQSKHGREGGQHVWGARFMKKPTKEEKVKDMWMEGNDLHIVTAKGHTLFRDIQFLDWGPNPESSNDIIIDVKDCQPWVEAKK